MGKLSFFLWLWLAGVSVQAKPGAVPAHWPAEAQSFLQSLPDKNLTLSLVIATALKNADTFQLHRTDAFQAEAAYLNVVALEDLKFTAAYNFFDQRNEPLVPQFMPIATKGWEGKLGFEQFFSSGTGLQVEGSHSPKKIGFLTQPDFEADETRLSVGLSQNLWGDFLGSSYRGLRRSADWTRRSIREGLAVKIESSVMDLIQLYYSAWLRQEVARSRGEAQVRRSQLARIFRQQERRGTVETPDLLQVEASALAMEVEAMDSQRELQGIWEQLVIQLKLPRSFLQINPMEIPIALDIPESKSRELCQKAQFADLEKNSQAIKQATALVSATQEKYQALRERLDPEVRLQANYTVNSIDSSLLTGTAPKASRTFQEVADLDNPALTAGVTLSIPLQNRLKKAQYLTARMEHEQATLRRSLLLSDLEAKWSLLCRTLEQKIHARDLYRDIHQKNEKRVRLDNRRFEVGRIKAFQWAQTEDDEASTNLRYRQAEVEVRQTAWEIQRQTGALIDQLKEHLFPASTQAEMSSL